MIQKIKHDYSVQSVDNVFDILDVILNEETAQATIPRICDQLGISRNKAFRLLSTLEKRGLVEREPSRNNYQLGITAVGLSQKILLSTSIIRHAHPVMEDLARKHDEAVYMTVLTGDDVMFLDMVDCGQKVKAAPLIGRRFPFFSNAPGKIIKALESRDMERIFKKGRRGKPICDLRTLESELVDIRRRGVAVDCNGLGDGVISVAVAVRDYAGKVIGAITLLGPSFRMLTERLENEIVPSLIEGAAMISEKFGYSPA